MVISTHTKQPIDLPVTKLGLTPAKMLAYLQYHPEVPGLVESYQAVIALANHVAAKNGRAFLVGGAVRDELLGLVPKDFDLEIHGLSVTALESLLTTFGVQQSTGKSFGTYKFPSSAGKIEVALPRRDSQMGAAHNDVRVDVQPHLGLTEAARRREFTIGAIYKDILTGEIFDPFHGIEDLKSKTLQLVDVKTFGDDSLRVLRGAAFAARFDLTVEPKTKLVMSSMVENMGALPKDRLREEWLKLLIMGEKPANGVELLHDVGVLDRWYPELAQLWTTPQDFRLHPEGDVGKHTMLVLDATAVISKQQHLPPAEHRELMFAALLHDTGKHDTTKKIDGRLHAYGHEAAGVKPTEIFLDRLGIPPTTVNRITALVTNHMRPASLYRERANITDRTLRKLSRETGPTHLRSLVILAEADHRGRGPFTLDDGTVDFPDTSKYHSWWNNQIERLDLCRVLEPILWGRDLVESNRAWPAGPLVGEVVRLAEELAIQGMTRENVLEVIDRAESPSAALVELRSSLDPEE